MRISKHASTIFLIFAINNIAYSDKAALIDHICASAKKLREEFQKTGSLESKKSQKLLEELGLSDGGSQRMNQIYERQKVRRIDTRLSYGQSGVIESVHLASEATQASPTMKVQYFEDKNIEDVVLHVEEQKDVNLILDTIHFINMGLQSKHGIFLEEIPQQEEQAKFNAYLESLDRIYKKVRTLADNISEIDFSKLKQFTLQVYQQKHFELDLDLSSSDPIVITSYLKDFSIGDLNHEIDIQDSIPVTYKCDPTAGLKRDGKIRSKIRDFLNGEGIIKPVPGGVGGTVHF